MTFRNACEQGARIAYPDASDYIVSRIAEAIWESSPTGELWHVYGLGMRLQHGAPKEEIVALVKSFRGVEAAANQTFD